MTGTGAANVVTFDDFLGAASLEELRESISEWSERNGQVKPEGSRHVGQEQLDRFELPPSLHNEIEDRVRRLVPLVRRSLAIPHFPIDDVIFVVGLHGAETSVHSRPFLRPTGARRLEFILHLAAGPEPFTGGGLAVANNEATSASGPPEVAEVERVSPDDNRVVFFASDVHHEVEPTQSDSARPSRYTLWGWVTERDAALTRARQDHQSTERSRRAVPLLSEAGFVVRPTPRPVQNLLQSLLEVRSSRSRPEEADTTFHLGPDNDFIDIAEVADDVLRFLLPIHEAFAGVPLAPSAMYGLRNYRAGATLRMHRDRVETHVISSVLQIAQDVDEPWTLEVEVGGKTHEILLSPGQMVLYEGASCAHGRPKPLVGRSFVNVFVHYRPIDWPLGGSPRDEP